MDWLTEAQALANAGMPFALATVVRRVAPASAAPGAKALIQQDGTMTGWVGGSCAQPVVVREAQLALQRGEPRLVRLGEMPGAHSSDEQEIVTYPMTCHSGGALEILLEPVLPPPRVIVVGETPVAATLSAMAALLGYRVAPLSRAEHLQGTLNTGGGANLVVCASMGVDDEQALLVALRAHAPYVALVASPTRAEAVRRTLRAAGLSENDLAGLKAPAGLDIGARSQEEIALSILAEITQLRSMLGWGETEIAAGNRPEDAAEQAIDPVCGMTVVISGARHQSEFRGKHWYFCCGGCQAQFEANPETYAAA